MFLFAPLEHPLDWKTGLMANIIGDFNHGLVFFQALEELGDGVKLHEATIVAGAMVGGAGYEGLFGEFSCEPVHHAGFGQYDESVRRVVATKRDHFLGAAYFVGEVANGFYALRVGDYGGGGMLESTTLYGLLGKEDVGVATARPELHRPTRVLGHPLAKVLVGDEEDFLVGRHLLDDFYGVTAGADYVAEGLDGCRTIDVGDDVYVGVFLTESGQFLRRARIGKGATRVDVGK